MNDAVIDKELVLGGKVAGVTYDGKHVWYASIDALVAVDPETEQVARRLPVKADAGTAYDGTHLYQISDGKILVVDPTDGRVVRELRAPGKSGNSGLAYADGFLFVGDYKDGRIHKIDAKTGDVAKTFASDKWVTGVSVVDGALWHATDQDGPGVPEIRRIADDGTVEEVLAVPDAKLISGLESDGKGGFWCGGENGKLRHVRRGKKTA